MNLKERVQQSLGRERGQQYEALAEKYLRQNGLKSVKRNYSCRGGEIDLIMRDDEFVVFVEVRYRARDDHGSALESITKGKQRRVALAASHYLSCNPKMQSSPCRFDAVGISGDGADVKFDWVRGAFSA